MALTDLFHSSKSLLGVGNRIGIEAFLVNGILGFIGNADFGMVDNLLGIGIEVGLFGGCCSLLPQTPIKQSDMRCQHLMI